MDSVSGSDEPGVLPDALAAPSVVLDGAGAVRATNPSFTRQKSGEHRCLPVVRIGDSFLDAFADHAEALRDLLAGEREHARTDWQCPDLRCGRWWSVRSRPLRGMPGAVVTHVDVTRRKRLEEQERQSQKLEAVGRLAAGVAHDLNNVLTGVLGYADLLGRRLADGSEEIDGIRTAVGRARDLVDDLLAFSQRRTGTAAVHDLNDILRAVLPAVSAAAGPDVAVDLSLHDEPCPVRFDRPQLEQVVAKLVSNAREAMPGGGTLSLVTSLAGDRVTLRVSDTGAGMDEATRLRAVEPFFTTRSAEGHTGLGLSMAYGVVAQAGGDLLLQSHPGRGTAVVVELPVAAGAVAPAPGPAPTPAPAPPGGQGQTGVILLVEDEAMIRDVMASVLGDQGYTVLAAADGGQALALAADADRVDLVVTDVQMPQMDGPTLVSRLRRERAGVEVLFMTGYTERRLDGAALGDPAPRVLRKPFGLQELLDAVTAVLGGR